MPKHVFYKSWYPYTTEFDQNRKKKRTLVVLIGWQTKQKWPNTTSIYCMPVMWIPLL